MQDGYTDTMLCYRVSPFPEVAMEDIDWSICEDVERNPKRVSGAWVVKNTRLPVDAILIHADEYTPEEIATGIFDGVTPDVVRRIIDFARQHAAHPA
jgi:uncharacterized protein (DUF433 family)